VERVQLEAKQGLVGLGGEITNAGDYKAEQPDQGVDGADAQGEELAGVPGGGGSARHAAAPSVTTDRCRANPTLPPAAGNRRHAIGSCASRDWSMRHGCVLGGPAVRTACGGHLSLTCLPLKPMPE
jgi:hypothetical protein